MNVLCIFGRYNISFNHPEFAQMHGLLFPSSSKDMRRFHELRAERGLKLTDTVGHFWHQRSHLYKCQNACKARCSQYLSQGPALLALDVRCWARARNKEVRLEAADCICIRVEV